jgi:hypothetical protein
MRSELIFRAKETVANKYKLCQTASKATRRLHISSTNTTDTINSAFARIADDLNEPIAISPLPILLNPDSSRTNTTSFRWKMR